jgi:hypothetical protein
MPMSISCADAAAKSSADDTATTTTAARDAIAEMLCGEARMLWAGVGRDGTGRLVIGRGGETRRHGDGYISRRGRHGAWGWEVSVAGRVGRCGATRWREVARGEPVSARARDALGSDAHGATGLTPTRARPANRSAFPARLLEQLRRKPTPYRSGRHAACVGAYASAVAGQAGGRSSHRTGEPTDRWRPLKHFFDCD